MQTITPQQLKEKLDSGEVLVIDVREPFEYSDWHIPGAVNVPVSRVLQQKLDVPKDRKIVAVCAHGFRSQSATRYLSVAGYDVRTLEGGMVEWNGVYDIVKISDKVIQVRRVGKGCLSYVLIDSSEAVVIDPTIDTEVYTDFAKEKNLKIIAALDTHAHADHASGGRMLAELGIKYYAPDEVGRAKETIKDGDVIRFGTTNLSTIASPGHTPASLCYRFGRFIFTGDTLFVDSVGRPDLGQSPAENAPILYDTLQKLLSFPDSTVVLPAHTEIENIHPETPIKETIEYIKELPIFKKGKNEFVAWIAGSNTPAPNNFEIIKKFNTGEIIIDTIEEFRELEAGTNRCAVK